MRVIILTALAVLFSIESSATGISPSAPSDLCVPISSTSISAFHRSSARLLKRLAIKNLEFGAPIFIRIFKQENELELWLQDDNEFRLFKKYAICHNSGTIGPKLKEGDKQSPEGFYQVDSDQMNPWSKYHLSFNLGYPNLYDRFYNRTGSALMVHGRCSSIGCFAMTDYYMDEIYTLASSALSNGQSTFQVHIFPFRLSKERLNKHLHSRWYSFWSNLKEGYDFFETHHKLPQIFVLEGKYYFTTKPDRPFADISSASPASFLPTYNRR